MLNAKSTQKSKAGYASTDFSLGPWRVEPRRQRLICTRDGSERRLEPRLMRLLCLLVQAEGEVLTREHLQEALWPRAVVTENSLTRAISDLRRHLRHPAWEDSPIETIPRLGYCLRLPAARIPVTGIGSWPRRTQAALGGLTLASLLLGLWLFPGASNNDYANNNAPDTADAPRHLAQPLDRVLDESVGPEQDYLRLPVLSSAPTLVGPRLASPDGSLQAYVSYGDEGSEVHIASPGQEHALLTVYRSAGLIHHLQWSPVGHALIFAVSPAQSPASAAQQSGRLMLFDLERLETREIWRASEEESAPTRDSWSRESGSMT